MATQTATSPVHTPTPDEPMEDKVTEIADPIEKEAVSLDKKAELEESPKTEEAPTEVSPPSKTAGEVEDKQTEPLPVEIKKVDDAPVTDNPAQDKMNTETVKDIVLDSHIASIPESIPDAVKSQPATSLAAESIVKATEEHPAVVTVEKVLEQLPKTVEASESSADITNKPKESAEVISVKEREVFVVEDTKDSEVPKQGNKSEPGAPEVEVKPEEQPEVTKQGEKRESVEGTHKLQEPSAVVPVEEAEAVVAKDAPLSAVLKEVDKAESVIPGVGAESEENSEVIKHVEKPESVEAIERSQETSEVVTIKSPEAVATKDVEDSETVPKEIEKTESVVPEAEIKLEGESEISKQVEEPEAAVHEVEAKQEEQSGVAEQDEIKSAEPVIETKAEVQTEVIKEVETKREEVEPKVDIIETGPVKDEGPLVDKTEDTTSIKEKENISEKEEHGASSEQVVSINQENEAGAGHEKKEIDDTNVAEVSAKESVVETGKGGEEKEETAIKTEGESVERELASEEVTEKSIDEEKTDKGVGPIVSNKGENTQALVETSKNENIEGKLGETTTIASEPVKESQDSELQVKEEGAKTTAKTLEKSEVSESDTANLEAPIKDGDDGKTTQTLAREVAGKPTQKQSNNILTKVKHSLVKAKKAIIGKSPSSKTISSDARDDIKVK